MPQQSSPFSLTGGDDRVSAKTMLLRFAERLLALDHLSDTYMSLPETTEPADFLRHALDAFDIDVHPGNLSRIPSEGPVIVVANHPFGGVDGMLLARTLLGIRGDVKMLANFLLTRLPQLAPMIIEADPFAEGAPSQMNSKAARASISWLRKGGMLLVFPAGEVSSLDLRAGRIQDPVWSPSFVRLAKRTGAAVVPVHVHGRNSNLFQLAGLLHPRLRTALLPREMIRKSHERIRLTVGRPIPGDRLARFENEEAAAHWIREAVYLLDDARHGAAAPARQQPLERADGPKMADIAAPQDPARITAEIEALPASAWHGENGKFGVCIARADAIPTTLLEVGRLREITFRAVGEGTGKALDLDHYDPYYLHLVLWDRNEKRIAGGYRLGLADEICERYGVRGLYTHSLFRYRKQLFDRLNPALELGRSFVVADYQRSFTPLLLLWRGICEYVVRNPKYRYLYGPVSISATYQTPSQALLVRFLESHVMAGDLVSMVRPKHPPRLAETNVLAEGVNSELAQADSDIELIGELMQQWEEDGKNVPVLLRQYLRMGGRFLGFNLDPGFGDAIDCLVLVDFLNSDARSLKRYMAPEGYASFLRFHGREEAPQDASDREQRIGREDAAAS